MSAVLHRDLRRTPQTVARGRGHYLIDKAGKCCLDASGVQSARSSTDAARDADGRFGAFAQAWSDACRASGRPQRVVTGALAAAGLLVDSLPVGVRFQ